MDQPSNTVPQSPSLQKQGARMIREALSELLKAARRAQPDAANMSDIQARLVSCVAAAHVLQEVIADRNYDSYSQATQDHRSQLQEETQAELVTLDAAEAAVRSTYETLCAVFEALPDEQLGQRRLEGANTDMIVADVLFMSLYGLSYQTGQIDLLNHQAC